MTDDSGTVSQVDLDSFDLGIHYKAARQRISSVVAAVDDPAGVPVPACPGWSVHDVVAHLTAVVEDVLAGRRTGPPSEDETAAQVARRQNIETALVLAEWAELAPTFEGLLSEMRVWPGFLDVFAHEHDVMGALSVPGERDSYEMHISSEWLLSNWSPAVPVRVKIGERERTLLPKTEPTEPTEPEEPEEPEQIVSDDDIDLTLTTTAFEAFRFRLGRRSRAQLRAMDWSGDPTPVIEKMTVFGPEPYDIIE
ncbi:MAG: maleylpyruvate isomerase N-terminal domain-containing protein [Acidimicrobiales bacterium]